MPREAKPGLLSLPSMPNLTRAVSPLHGVASIGFSNFQLLQWMLSVVFLLHAADGAMLPGVFKALEEGLDGATPISLGHVLMLEALCHSLAVLVWGVLADRACKLTLLAYSTVAWALLTLATACVAGIRSLLIVRALAGIVGAGLGPVAQGIIAAVSPAETRGCVFGIFIAFGEAGRVLGLLLAGSTSHVDAVGGWRSSFVLFSFFTMALSWALFWIKTEVSTGFLRKSRTWRRLAARKRNASDPPESTAMLVNELCANFALIIRRRSFLVLLLQGAFASTMMKAMSYQVMWYQYLGFSDLTASAITSAAPLGCIAGAVVGGFISDSMAEIYPSHGRITLGQMGHTLSLIVLVITFFVCANPKPDEPGIFWSRTALSFIFGFVSIMAYASVVKPLFAEIVPPQLVAQVIGFAAAIDGACSSILSTHVVGYITEDVFKYRDTTLTVAEMPEEMRRMNAAALGSAIALVTISSSLLSVLAFGLLHCTYPHDCRESKIEDVDEESAPLVTPESGTAASSHRRSVQFDSSSNSSPDSSQDFDRKS